MHIRCILATVALFASTGQIACAIEYGLPSGVVSGSVGLNLGWNVENWNLLAGTGAGVVRTNLYWSVCEKTLGVYDFDLSDDNAMVAACGQRGIRVMYDMFWGNPLYGETDMGSATWRQNYANFAGAAAANFAGKGVIYELWNEPNGYGQGAEIPANYIAFVDVVSSAIRAADPSAVIVGPAVGDRSETGPAFLADCYDLGLLDKLDAISLHLYADASWLNPEQVVGRLADARSLMQTHGGKVLPIISGEWGYTLGAVSSDEVTQAKYCARSLLTNLSEGVPISIWFEFRDRPTSGDYWEGNFGLIAHDDTTNAYQGIRPAYYAMQELTQSLRGTTFSQRRTDGWGIYETTDWLLEFDWPTGDGKTLAAWTSWIENPHYVYLDDWGWVYLTDTPIYLNPVPVPEPGTLLLSFTVIAGAFACYRRTKGGKLEEQRPYRMHWRGNTCLSVEPRAAEFPFFEDVLPVLPEPPKE